MPRMVWLFAVVVACCGGESTGPDVDIGGWWTLVGNLSNTELMASCFGGGTAEIHQTGSTFRGAAVQTRSCNGYEVVGPNPTSRPITEGEIIGNAVTFRIDTCVYTGTLNGSDVMTGFTTCSLSTLGESYPFEGQWHAGRR